MDNLESTKKVDGSLISMANGFINEQPYFYVIYVLSQIATLETE